MGRKEMWKRLAKLESARGEKTGRRRRRGENNKFADLAVAGVRANSLAVLCRAFELCKFSPFERVSLLSCCRLAYLDTNKMIIQLRRALALATGRGPAPDHKGRRWPESSRSGARFLKRLLEF